MVSLVLGFVQSGVLKALGSIARRTIFVGVLASVSAMPAFAQEESSNQMESDVRVRIEFNGSSMTAVLYDNPSARDFAAMLPLDLQLEDYADNEKIAYLPRKLTGEGSGPFDNESPGDLAYYAPWGNLIMYYGSYRYSGGLIRLGRLESGIAPLLVPGKFDVHIEIVP